MTNKVLWAKLNAIRQSKYFSDICDEYSDVSNKEQLSFCVRWIEENLKVIEDFLGYYELPNIQSDTIVAAIEDSVIRFELPLQNLREQTYHAASNMMGKNSGVTQQILKEQLKALSTHCHGQSLSLSIKYVTKQCRILNDVMGTVGEITVLIKFSPKPEKMLGAINENITFSNDGGDDDFEQAAYFSKLSVTRKTFHANAFNKVCKNIYR